MEDARNVTVKALKVKGSWENMLSDLKKHFTFQPDIDMKFMPPRENELLSNIETRLNRYRGGVGKIIKNEQTENA